MMIIDASVASHWFAHTEFSAVADPYRWYSDLRAPDFLLIETGNVLYKRSRLGQIAPGECAESIDILRNLMAELVAGGDLLGKAIELALRLQHPVYDCLYLTLADARKELIVTADKRLCTAASRLALDCSLIKPTGSPEFDVAGE